MVCRDKHPFALPEPLVKALKSRSLVLFAGAGISTEGRHVFPHSFRQELVADLAEKGREIASDESFAGVATAYEEVFGRTSLIQSIRARLDYAAAFPTIYRSATEFHTEISTIPVMDSIVTTNWDTYFEDETGALPITIPEDYAYWDLPDRKVFKIHGSVANLSTIVATKADYAKCFRRLRSGVIGSSLKHLLATKLALFVGFSFGDSDFAQIYGLLRRELKDILPRSYIVTLDHRITPETHPGATVLHTAATFFISELKRRLVDDQVMIPDKRFDGPERMRVVVAGLRQSLQEQFPPKRYPMVIYSAAYQDGLADALDRMLAKRKTGTYSHSHDVFWKASSYHEAEKIAIRKRKYYDAAYIRGYTNGVLYLVFSDKERRLLPLYFLYGAHELRTVTAFRRFLARAEELHKAAYRHAMSMTKGIGENLNLYHPPFLDLGDLGDNEKAAAN
jgi:hypothetical protein